MCMKVKEVQVIQTELTGWVTRKEINGVLSPYYSMSSDCRGKVGDIIIDPLWNLECQNSQELIGKEIREGCLHVFKNLDDAFVAAVVIIYSSKIVVVEVAIQPGVLLIGETDKFDSDLDPLDCYGCKSYKLVKIVSEGE